MSEAEEVVLASLDRDGSPTDDDAMVFRTTVTDARGVVRTQVDYLDHDGNPASQTAATRSTATIYDAEGELLTVRDSWEDVDEVQGR